VWDIGYRKRVGDHSHKNHIADDVEVIHRKVAAFVQCCERKRNSSGKGCMAKSVDDGIDAVNDPHILCVTD
jgi:hypothetical protein